MLFAELPHYFRYDCSATTLFETHAALTESHAVLNFLRIPTGFALTHSRRQQDLCTASQSPEALTDLSSAIGYVENVLLVSVLLRRNTRCLHRSVKSRLHLCDPALHEIIDGHRLD